MTLQNVLPWKIAPVQVAACFRRLKRSSNTLRNTPFVDRAPSDPHTFRILCTRLNLACTSSSAREGYVLLECGDCDIAYGIRLDDPRDQFVRAEWDERIACISSVIYSEHSTGHPSFELIHDGILKAKQRRNSPLQVVPANEFHVPHFGMPHGPGEKMGSSHPHFEPHMR